MLIDGDCFSSPEAFHAEFSFKLGLPATYARTWDALLDCLSSIGTEEGNLCSHWDWNSVKRMVLSIRDFAAKDVDTITHAEFSRVIAEANWRLTRQGASNCIWIEYLAPSDQATPP
jgi:RNAse (barnase) inhibitor barstar